MKDLKQSIFLAIWFILLTFPIMVIRVNTVEKVVQWRWANMVYVGIGAFILSYLWRYMMDRKEKKPEDSGKVTWNQKLLSEKKYLIPTGKLSCLVSRQKHSSKSNDYKCPNNRRLKLVCCIYPLATGSNYDSLMRLRDRYIK